MDPVRNNQINDLLIQRSQTPTRPAPTAPGGGVDAKGPAFGDILADRLKVSGHAQTRLQSRNIEMNSAQWDRVVGGVERAAQKGSRESLVMVDDVALVVSVKNRTVITAVDKAQLKDNVFTNIDSAVIV